jgi:D-mannonate dehydratase
MTQQEIQERNLEIALMVGYMHVECDTKWLYLPNLEIDIKSFSAIPKMIHTKEMEFHSDWNWLMEAIQFLKKHFESKEMLWTTVERYPLFTDIETVFTMVSNFAKHYNEGNL